VPRYIVLRGGVLSDIDRLQQLSVHFNRKNKRRKQSPIEELLVHVNLS
jgi:hypothetical protein